MKRLSEVCEMIGVTRRTLQEYEKIGLLKHPAETEGGYWLYDEESIQKLMFIQIFVEAGYKRRDIKKIMDAIEDGEDVFTSELNKLIQVLEEKKRKIDGMIRTIESSLQLADLPYPVQKVVEKIYYKQRQEQSYKSMMSQSINTMAELSEDDFKEMSDGLPVMLCIVAIGACKGQPLSSKGVRHRIQDAMAEFKKMSLQAAEADSEDILEALTDEELNQSFIECVEDMLLDEECKEEIETQCGEGAAQYILDATHAYFGKSQDEQNVEERKD